MMRRVVILLAGLGVLGAGRASALALEPSTQSFSTQNVACTGGLGCSGTSASFTPEGLAYDTQGDTLLVLGEALSTTYLWQFNLDGTFTNPSAPALFALPTGNWRGLDYLSASNTVLASSETGAVRHFNLNGTLPTGGIDFLVSDTGAGLDVEGVVLHPDGNVYVSDDQAQFIRRYAGSGSSWTEDVAFRIDTDALNPLFDDPSGLQYDPTTGHLIVHDDSSGGFGSIWEIDLATRQLVTFTHPVTGLPVTYLNSEDVSKAIAACNLDGVEGCRDGEGIAYDPESGRFFFAYENESVIITYSRASAPEPSVAGLLLVGLATLARRRARRA